jgi:chain length determinant protein EpsF
LAIIRTHWVVASACVCALVLFTVGVSLLLPPKFTSTASILVDVRGVNPVLGVSESNTVLPRTTLATQASMVRSEGVARKVVTQLDLARDPVFVQAWQDDVESRGDLTAWIAKKLLKALDVRPAAEDSNVLDLQFSATDPKRAAAVVNAFAESYLATALQLRGSTAKVSADFFTQQSKTLRAQLEEAQNRLSDYQRQHGIVGGDERLDVENASLNELSTQNLQARAQRIEAGSRGQNASTNASQSPDVLTSPVVQQLLANIATADAQLKTAQSQYGPNHPQVQNLQTQLAQLRAALQSESSRAASALKMNDKINQQREGAIKEGLETQRKRVLALKSQRDGLSVLERDVDSARKAYDQAQQRQIQTSQEGSVPSPEASVLSVGVVPSESARPGLTVLVPLAIVLGAVVGVLAAILQEMRRPLIHFASDLEPWGVPVIATVPQARLPRWRPRYRSPPLLEAPA